MILHNEGYNALHVMTLMQNIARRFEKYGIESVAQHRARENDCIDFPSITDFVQTLVYDETQQDEEGYCPVCKDCTQDDLVFYDDIKVVYHNDAEENADWIEVSVMISRYDIADTYEVLFMIYPDGIIEEWEG